MSELKAWFPRESGAAEGDVSRLTGLGAAKTDFQFAARARVCAVAEGGDHAEVALPRHVVLRAVRADRVRGFAVRGHDVERAE